MKTALSVIFSLVTVSLFAQSNRQHYDYMQEQIDYFDSWWQNPAMRFYYPMLRFTDVSFSETITNQSVYNPQKGNKSNNFLFSANSFTKQEHQLFYGAASYSNGIQKNVNWNTLTDVDKLYPYIVADTIADKMYKEQYYFAGGYARRFQKIIAGIFTNYTAATAYDRRDPRPNNTVSNLQITAGVSTSIVSNYCLGVSLQFNQYQQDQSLSLYKDNGSAIVYYLRGFGVADRDFSTVITKNRGGVGNIYKQKQYEANVSLYPKNKKGFFANIGVTMSDLELETGNINQTVAKLENQKGNIALGYKINRNYSVKLFGEFAKQEGTEYIYKSSSELINKAKKYKCNNIILGTAIAGKINYSKQLKVNFVAEVKYRSFEQKYLKIGAEAPNRKKVNNLTFSFTKNVLKQFKKSSLLIKFGAKYRNNLHKELKAGYLITKNAMRNLVEPIYRYETENFLAASLAVRYDYPINSKYNVYAKANVACAYFKNKDKNKLYGIGIGLAF